MAACLALHIKFYSAETARQFAGVGLAADLCRKMIDAILLTKEDFTKMTDMLNALNEKISEMVPPSKNSMLDNDAFVKHMNISRRTAQTWRDQGKISFSQIGNKIYYRFTDIEKLLNDHRIDAFKINWK